MAARDGSTQVVVRELTDNGLRALARRRVQDSIALNSRLLQSKVIEDVVSVTERLVGAYQNGRKVLFFGNGGSAADAAHLAAEMCGRFLIDRPSLPAIALADNVAAITAIGNDYGFDNVFARQIEGLGMPGDVAIGISTSGCSENVIRGIMAARRRALWTVGLTGASGGRLAQVADLCLCVPSSEVPRVQEAHVLVGHIFCELVESALFEPQA